MRLNHNASFSPKAEIQRIYKYQHGHTNDVLCCPWQEIDTLYIKRFQVVRAPGARCGSSTMSDLGLGADMIFYTSAACDKYHLCLGAVKFCIISTDLLLWLKDPKLMIIRYQKVTARGLLHNPFNMCVMLVLILMQF